MTGFRHPAVVIGASAGGFEALRAILHSLKGPLHRRIAVVMHIPEGGFDFRHVFPASSQYEIREAVPGCRMQNGVVWLAPSGYHLLIEPDETLSLDVSEKVNHARPSIDVLFECAAEVYGQDLLGILLSGGGKDGVEGLRCIGRCGGAVVVQSPDEAEVPFLPRLAAESIELVSVRDLKSIGAMLSH